MADHTETPELRLLPGRHKRVRAGHPWVFSNEIAMDPRLRALPPGGIVRLAAASGEFLGLAGFNPHTLIAARIFARAPGAAIDRGFLAGRFAAALALREYAPAAEYLTAPDAIAERSVTWTDRRTGLLCKGRPDLVVPSVRAVVDVKSTASADPHRFGLLAGRMGYPLQMEHYAAGVEAVYGWEPERIVFLVVEVDAPHDCGALMMDGLHRRQARKDLDALLNRLAECRRTNEWPGRYPSAGFIQLPDYLLDDMTDDFTVLESA